MPVARRYFSRNQLFHVTDRKPDTGYGDEPSLNRLSINV